MAPSRSRWLSSRTLLALLDEVHAVLDELGRRIARRHLDRERVVQQAIGERADLVGEGGGEQQVLALLGQHREHPADVADEAHVEHAVRLVEHESATCERSTARWLMWSSSRPGVATMMSTPLAQRVHLQAGG